MEGTQGQSRQEVEGLSGKSEPHQGRSGGRFLAQSDSEAVRLGSALAGSSLAGVGLALGLRDPLALGPSPSRGQSSDVPAWA